MHDYTDPRATNPTPNRTGRKLLACFLVLGAVIICGWTFLWDWGCTLIKAPLGLEISAERYERIEAMDHWGPTHDLIVGCMRDGKIDLVEEKAIHDRYAKELLDELKWRLAN